MILYDTFILLCHIYEKNNIGTAWVVHLIILTVLGQLYVPGDIHHPELTKIFRIMQLFQ